MKVFQDRVVAVTGAASGIGKAIAEAFARRGAALALADIDATGLERMREKLEARGAIVEAWAVDVSDAGQVKRFCDEVYHRFGRVDVLCNNAGVLVGGRFEDITLDDLKWIMGVNLWGVLHGCLYFYPRMVAQGGGGHIVNVSSGLALAPLPGSVTYCTTKYGVVGFSETLRAEAARHGVGVTVVCPGFVFTNIFMSSRERTLAPRTTHEESSAGVERLLRWRRYDAARVAEKVVEAVERNRGVVPLCWEIHLGDFLHRLSRGLYGRLLALLARAWFRGVEGQETGLSVSGSGEAERDQVSAR